MNKINFSAVVPAKNGCNLSCAGCIIAQKGEAHETKLSHDEYVRFFTSALSMPQANGFNLQGYEPLLPDAWPLSRELLALSISKELRTSSVTNGTYLNEYGIELMGLTHSIFVSLDSADSVIHDKSRGKTGAWSRTVSGIHHMRAQFASGRLGAQCFSEYLSVASILYPKGENRLRSMPQLLKELGVKDWAVTPYISISKGGFSDTAYGSIKRSLFMLRDIAKEQGVTLILSDEMGRLGSMDENLYQEITVNTTEKPTLISRLSPNGIYAIGQEIVTQGQGSFWNSNSDPAIFIRTAHTKYSARY